MKSHPHLCYNNMFVGVISFGVKSNEGPESLTRYVCGAARKFMAADKSEVDSISMSCQWNKTWTPGFQSSTLFILMFSTIMIISNDHNQHQQKF